MTKLHIYDFDLTLYDEIYSRGIWIEEIVQSAKKSIADPQCITALCTARSKTNKIIYQTNSLLRERGLIFDYMIFKPLSFRGPNWNYKSVYINRLINQIPGVEEVCFWDDDTNNREEVEEMLMIKGIPCQIIKPPQT